MLCSYYRLLFRDQRTIHTVELDMPWKIPFKWKKSDLHVSRANY